MTWLGWTHDRFVSASWECRRVEGRWFLLERNVAKPRVRGPFRNLDAAMEAAA